MCGHKAEIIRFSRPHIELAGDMVGKGDLDKVRGYSNIECDVKSAF